MSKKEKPKTDPDLGVWTPAVVAYNIDNLSNEQFEVLYNADKNQAAKLTGLSKEYAKSVEVKVEQEEEVASETGESEDQEKISQDINNAVIDAKTLTAMDIPKPKTAKKTSKKAAKKKSKEVNND